MRIIILTVDHMYANKVVKDVLDRYGRNVKLIIESDCLLYNKSFMGSLKKYFMVSGLQYVAAQAAKLEIYKTLRLLFGDIKNGPLGSKFYHFEKAAKIFDIPVKKIFNVNSKEGLRIIKKAKPDLIVSILFNQILGKDIIAIPKRGVINLHPANLPDYKGVSPVFWALSNSEKSVGVSVHHINQGIDTGNILARQKIVVARGDTEDSLYWKLVNAGSKILLLTIDKIYSGKKVRLIKNIGGRYFSLPTKEAVRKYLKKRKTFFKLSDVLFQK